ncbi:MAG: phage terminase large subunit, partial [Planctomycetota bacterium]
FVMIVSATKEQASQLLKHAKDEIETNPRIHRDFPEVDPSGPNGKPSPWRGNKFQLPNGAMIWSVGLGQQIRGLRHRADRPSLIVADDLEMPEHVASAEQRAKAAEWFNGSLLKIGDDRTNVIVVGTILHYDSLLSNLLNPIASPGWDGRKYRALIAEPIATDRWTEWESIFCGRETWQDATGRDAARAYFEAHRDEMLEGGEALWPEREPVEALMELRVREGRVSFDSEKQNEPLDPEHCLFKPESFIYWDDEFADPATLISALGSDTPIYAAWDPSLGRDPRRGDYSAIVVGARRPGTKLLHIIAADLVRVTPAKAIERLVEYAKMYKLKAIGVEANGFQEVLALDLKSALRRSGVSPRIREYKNTGEKAARIASLQPRIEQGMVRFSRRHTLFLEQLRQFPLGAHDDGPDALEMLVRASRYVTPKIGYLDWNTGRIHYD